MQEHNHGLKNILNHFRVFILHNNDIDKQSKNMRMKNNSNIKFYNITFIRFVMIIIIR